jgi:hypothetical protein
MLGEKISFLRRIQRHSASHPTVGWRDVGYSNMGLQEASQQRGGIIRYIYKRWRHCILGLMYCAELGLESQNLTRNPSTVYLWKCTLLQILRHYSFELAVTSSPQHNDDICLLIYQFLLSASQSSGLNQ